LQLINPSTSPNELNTTLTPHSIIHGDACFAYFNKIWGIPDPGTVEEVPPAHNGTAATANSLSICQMIGSAAAANGLPFEFLARVIWQESRFRPDAVGLVQHD
jgi:soluble lytic murein transglycosylase-like protein